MKMSVREARAQFAAAIAAAERGEPVIITRNGKAVAQIAPPPPPAKEVRKETAEEFWARLDRIRKELGLDKYDGPPLDEKWREDFDDPKWTREVFGPEYFDEEPASR